eukprot:5829362-Pleurochrysis_carterae.AAC.1
MGAAGAKADAFYCSTRTSWCRMSPKSVEEPVDFDADDPDVEVQVAEPEAVQQMLKVRRVELPVTACSA